KVYQKILTMNDTDTTNRPSKAMMLMLAPVSSGFDLS
ncbi:MAG: hypothetical protein ACI8RD_011113, partial [Bacillariaceae sp.]